MSRYKFTDPIRYFKANDPYYWEVDNIPLKQLQENCLWLKENSGQGAQGPPGPPGPPGDSGSAGQDGSDGNVNLSVSASRLNFVELQPFAMGNDRTIHVRPGRFTGRVNSAYDKSFLAKLRREHSNLNLLFTDPARTAEVATKMVNLAQQTAIYNINGLLDRYRTWNPTDPVFPLITWGSDSSLPVDENHPLLGTFTGPDQYWPELHGVFSLGGADGQSFSLMSKATEQLLVRQWRGVARTAIVDVPSELTIDIPAFDDNDFFYWDDSTKHLIDGPQYRIDLVFIYTKPIDADKATLSSYTKSGDVVQPKVIYQPTLGVVKGAGLGARFEVSPNNVSLGVDTVDKFWTAQGAASNGIEDPGDGTFMIKPNVADENSATNGFKRGAYNNIEVHGSFPSPDDLMNLTPNLMANLEPEDFQLIGQSILPICYVLVPKQGSPVLADHILDIRPFFRTAELSYNERAGLAAATPQVSLANPVVSRYELQDAISKIELPDEGGGTEPLKTNVLAKGTVWGGLMYGPEGALWNLANPSVNTNVLDCFNNRNNMDGMSDSLLSVLDYSLNSEAQIPLWPSWDFPSWNSLPEYSASRGKYMNDWMDEIQTGAGGCCPGMLSETRLALEDSGSVEGTTDLHSGDYLRLGGYGPGSVGTKARFVKKRIRISKIPDWVKDIQTVANFSHCSPLTSEGGGEDWGQNLNSGTAYATLGGVHVSKERIALSSDPNIGRYCFIDIIAYWPGTLGGMSNPPKPWTDRNNWRLAAMVAHSAKQIAGTGGDTYAMCVYPTVEFSITGLSQETSAPQHTSFGIPADYTQKSFSEVQAMPTAGLLVQGAHNNIKSSPA